MHSVIQINFHRNEHVNDLSAVERDLFPVFMKKTEKDKQHWKFLKSYHLKAYKQANKNIIWRHILWFSIDKVIQRGIKRGKSLFEIEALFRAIVRKLFNPGKEFRVNAIKKTRFKFAKIKNYILGTDILDFGGGDGMLGLAIKEKLKKNVLLADVVDYNLTDLPLFLYSQDEKVPLEDLAVDTTIMYLVLHHANNPAHALQEAARLTKKRMIIHEAYFSDEKLNILNSFGDWFYNRVLNDNDVNVPLNFLPANGWRKLIDQVGFKVTGIEYLGVDDPISPGHHFFMIADR